MSYIKEKEKMNKEAQAHREQIWSLIKKTFMAFSALLLIFCVTLVISLIIGPSSDDEEPPVISPSSSLRVVGYVGDTPTYREYVKVSDNVDKEVILMTYTGSSDIDVPEGKIALLINAQEVNKDKEGSYNVYYIAIDSAGNISHTSTIIYQVKSKEYSEETLMELIAELSEDLHINANMSKEAQVRAIYKYVNSKNAIQFEDVSNIPNINRNRWETDWVEEAIRTIESGYGDCYSYYSLSKAFFEYWGIENRGRKRAEGYEGSAEDGTHFWSVVKVEQGWYYYDATSLRGSFSDGSKSACLITEEKLKSYVGSNGEDFFYRMTKPVGFPNISTKELG